MNQLGTVYATKRRRRNGKSLKPSPKESSGKSNPSKRHRERLNAELDTLASLLPFEASILSKLDRLSILRLSVSYLRTKSYFQVSLHKGKGDHHGQQHHLHHSVGGGHFLHDNAYRNRDLTVFDSPALDGECFLQALNGFLLILTSDGEVFFATHTIESYLGFHQSDVVHQSVYELVHSEDREELQRQLTWNSQLPADSGLSLMDALRPENSLILERSFTVRFRCLLDNTSGFLRLDIRGRVKVLHGQNRKTEEPPLALFAICTPFGPPSLLELPHKESMFKSKHRLDLALVSMDQRGKVLLGHSDAELSSLGGYDLVHYDDLAYVASAHQELLKTGASGLIAYRLQTKDGQFQWLQTSSRLVYKNSKPDFIISTHRPLMEEEGRDLMGKRTMDFKVSYLDAGLTSSYFSDHESSSLPASAASTATAVSSSPATPATTLLPPSSQPITSSSQQPTAGTQRVGRKYKNQLRDFLTNCRTKRKSGSTAGQTGGNTTPPEYLPSGVEAPVGGWGPGTGGGSAAAVAVASSAAVAAAATAYSPSVYPAAAAAAAAAVPYTDNSFYHSMTTHHHHAGNHHGHLLHQPNPLHHQMHHQSAFYPALDNRFGIPTAADNLFHHHHHHHGYRGLAGAAGYYAAADYSPYVAAATTNGFLTGYDSTMAAAGMSQLYSNSSPSASPADSSGGGGKYGGGGGSTGSTPNRLSLHHHGGGVLLTSSGGETEPSSESSAASNGGSDSPYQQHPHPRRGRNKAAGNGEMMQQQQMNGGTKGVVALPVDEGGKGVDGRHSSNSSGSGGGGGYNGGSGSTAGNDTRQTVLMWGSSTTGGGSNNNNNNTSSGSCHSSGNGVMATADLISPSSASAPTPTYPNSSASDCGTDVKKYVGQLNNHQQGHQGYNGSNHHGGQQQQQQNAHSQQQQQLDMKQSPNGGSNLDLNSACKWGRVGVSSHYLYGASAAAAAAAAHEVAGATEVSAWPHSYPYPYHHQYHHQTHYASADHAAHQQYSSSSVAVHHQSVQHHHSIPAGNPHHSSTNSSASYISSTARTGVLCCPSPR